MSSLNQRTQRPRLMRQPGGDEFAIWTDGDCPPDLCPARPHEAGRSAMKERGAGLLTEDAKETILEDWARVGRDRRKLYIIAQLNGCTREQVIEVIGDAAKNPPSASPRGKPTRINWELGDRLILEREKTSREIAKTLGCNPQSVRGRANQMRVKLPNPASGWFADKKKIPRQTKLDAVLRYLGGEPREEVAKNLGISPNTLSGWCRKYKEGKL